MKPGAAWREEPWWHWGYPSATEQPLTQGSGGHVLDGEPQHPSSTVAQLWVPDPEARRGWREYYVYRDRQPSERRKLGLSRW